MKFNKKIIFISWLIGLGFGLFISGIILSILLYVSNKTIPVATNVNELIQVENNHEEMQFLTIDEEVMEDIEEKFEEEPDEEIVEEEIKEEMPEDVIEVEIRIPYTANARQITSLLLEHHIITDYDEFLNYVISMGATRQLAHGTKKFPLNSDIETIFKILRPEN